MSMLFTHTGVLWENFENMDENKQQKMNMFRWKTTCVYQIGSHTSFKITKYSEQYVLWVIAFKCSRKSGHCLLTRMSLKFWSFFFAVFWAMLMRNEEETAKMTLMHYISTEAVQ